MDLSRELSKKKLFAFDLDGTLAESKLPITEERNKIIERLAREKKIVIISGGSFERFEAQFLGAFSSFSPEALRNIYLLPTDGSKRYEYNVGSEKWEVTDRMPFSEEIKEKVKKVFEEIIASKKYEIPEEHAGDYVEDRDTDIAFSALGQQADLEKKKLWDPDQRKRQKIKAAVEEKLPEVEVSIAGTTTLDILPKGFTKAVGIDHLLKKIGITKEEVLFFGDAVFPGGNDYAVYEAGIKTIKVATPEETYKILEKILAHFTPTSSPLSSENPIAFFCAEYALDDDATMYAGGLGVLAGDYMLEIAEQNVPCIAFGLKYGTLFHKEYVLLEEAGKPIVIEIPIGLEIIKAHVWERKLGKETRLLLLDTNIPENTPENRNLSAHLYDVEFFVRLKQQIVLGIGGIRLLKKLNIHPSIYHLNEGHTAFAGVAVLTEKKEDAGKIVASKHTILPEAGLHISKFDFENLLGNYFQKFGVDKEEIYKKGEYTHDPLQFSTTRFIMTISQRKNGVSVLHAEAEKVRHPQSELIPITNGVYKKRWQAPELSLPLEKISDEELVRTKKILRTRLIKYVEENTGKKLDPNICTIVWARRFASYKRPFLLFTDYERIIRIATNMKHPVQFVISGKAHEADKIGQGIAEKIKNLSNNPRSAGRIALLPKYSISVAHELECGADIWINTPIRGKEACGTSGMKASLNGAIQFSISDGWIDEVSKDGRLDGKGWILPDKETDEETAKGLYDILEHEILPKFYEQTDWVKRMRGTIELVEKDFTTTRMLRDYMEKLYKI